MLFFLLTCSFFTGPGSLESRNKLVHTHVDKSLLICYNIYNHCDNLYFELGVTVLAFHGLFALARSYFLQLLDVLFTFE